MSIEYTRWGGRNDDSDDNRGERRRIQLKMADIPKSGLNDSLNSSVNLAGRLNAEEREMNTLANHHQTEGTHKRGSGSKIGRPVTTSARSETDANTVRGIVES